MARIVCTNCMTGYVASRIGVVVIETMSTDTDPRVPYKLWNADQLRCPGCGHTIVANFGDKPMSVRHDEDFERVLKSVRHSAAHKPWLIVYQHEDPPEGRVS